MQDHHWYTKKCKCGAKNVSTSSLLKQWQHKYWNKKINMNKSSISENGKENTSSIWKIKHEYITYLWNIKHKYTKVNKAVSVTYTHLNIGFCTSAHMLCTKCTLTVCNKVYSSEAKCKMVVSMPGLTYTLIWPARLIGHWKPSTCFQVKPDYPLRSAFGM